MRFLLTATVLLTSATAAEHPRLLLSLGDIAPLRAKLDREPYASIRQRVECLALRADEPAKNVLYDNRAVDLATLHLITGDQSHAAAAEAIVLAMVEDTAFWNKPDSKGLSRAAGALRASLAYDLCHDTWSAATRAKVSQKLRYAADGLMKSMGQGANTSLANNWQAVRYGAAGLAYLACDEEGSVELAKGAYQKLLGHLKANLGDNGWNPEGIGYTTYPWNFTAPCAIAIERAGLGNLGKDLPRAGMTHWTCLAGTVPIPFVWGAGHTNGPGIGLRADFGDDHALGGSSLGMAFRFLPREQHGALRHLYQMLQGTPQTNPGFDSGDGSALYSLLYFPEDVPAADPKDVPGLGLHYRDQSHGLAIFRNRFRDAEDIVLVVNAHSRQPEGAHGGPDTNTFRLIGLGEVWVVGGGRTGEVAGQTNLFPASLPDRKSAKGLGALEHCNTTPDGGGNAVLSGSCMGVTGHRRAIGIAFEQSSGAAAVLVNAETSADGARWRLQTPECQKIATAGNRFTITGLNGATLVGTVLEPANAQFTTGTVERGGGAGHVAFPYKDNRYINNSYLELACQGQVLVVMTLQGPGSTAPAVSGTGDATAAELKIGSASATLKDGVITFGK